MIQLDFYFVVKVIAVLQTLKLVWIYYIRRPDSMRIAGIPTIFGRWLTSIMYTLQEPNLITKAYCKAAGKPFAIPSLTGYKVCISDLGQIRELCSAPRHQLSLNAFLGEVLSPERIGIKPFPKTDYQDKISVVALKTHLRSNLSAMRKGLQQTLETAFGRELHSSTTRGDWRAMRVGATSFQIVGSLNCFIILGETLAREPLLVKEVLHFAHDAAVTMELLRFTPYFLQHLVASVSMGWRGSYRKVYKAVDCEVRARLAPKDGLQDTINQERDCIQWTINASGKSHNPNLADIMHRTMGLLVASAHQIPSLVAFAIYNLCKHPEYIKPLRDEISRMVDEEVCGVGKHDTPLLESFLKETARLQPLQIVTINRKVMEPYFFSDGTHVPAGNTICVPQQAVMRDRRHYDNPLDFDGYRFVTEDGAGAMTSTSRFSHPCLLFPFWGSVGRPCPARFYASMVAKMVMIHIIKNYDIKLADEGAKHCFSWDVTVLPHPNLTVLLRERKHQPT